VVESASSVVNVAANPVQLGQESAYFSGRTTQLINTGAQLASLHEDSQVREEIILTLKNVSIVNSNLLVVAKSVSSNPDAPGARNQLNAAAR
jgi:talin